MPPDYYYSWYNEGDDMIDPYDDIRPPLMMGDSYVRRV